MHAKTLEACSRSFSLFTLSGGSSSIRFALFDVSEPLPRPLDGKVDRVGLSGTKVTFKDAAGQSPNGSIIDSSDRRLAVGLLLNWLETQPVFASVTAAGHRVVHGMTQRPGAGCDPNETKRVIEAIIACLDSKRDLASQQDE